MNRNFVRRVYQLASILLLPPMFAILAAQMSSAQTTKNSSWLSHAEPRIKGIYERGEFRAKSFRPKWLSDSSGFLLDEVDPSTSNQTTWFFNATTGERRSATNDEVAALSDGERPSVNREYQLETRDDKLIAVNRKNKVETTLATSAANREVDFRKPVLSPDGAKVLFVEADYTDVMQRWVLVPGDPSYPDVKQNRFARVGGQIEKLRIGVVNVDGDQVSWLPVACPEEGMYLGQIEWAGNSNEILVERFSRFRDRRDFLLINDGGEVKTIFSESDKTWVEASQGWNSGLAWIRGGQEFIVISEKDGWRHAYRYARDGKELALLTPGDYDIIDRAIIDEERGWYYFYASPKDGTQKYLYRVALDGTGKAVRVSPENQIGTHGYVFSPDAKWAVHSYSTLNTPPVHELIEAETHRVVTNLEDNSAIRDRMNSLRCQPAEFLKLDIGNGIEFDAWMLKPKDLDPTKKYPLFIYVYGEPHAQTVLNEWGAAQIDFHRVVAELGYVVVSIDNRGTPCPKGAAWRRAIFGSLGPLSTDEQEAGLIALAKQCDFIDTDRVGIWAGAAGVQTH